MRRILIAALIATLALTAPALADDHGAPAPGTVEVLLRDAQGQPTVARVALDHGLPAWAESRMHLGGTWSYLLAEPDGVVVFDVGPRYPLAWSVLPYGPAKAHLQPMPGNRQIIRAVRRTFPGRPISAILISHWHPDHSEDAPALQDQAAAIWGVEPPLRIMAADRRFRWRGVIPAGADAVFEAAGFKRGSWTWGPDLVDRAPVGKTGFRVLAMPGHTRGNIALVHEDLKVSIGPPPRVQIPKYPFWTEDLGNYPATVVKFYQATYGYRHFSTHPGRELREDWPYDRWTPPRKLQATQETLAR